MLGNAGKACKAKYRPLHHKVKGVRPMVVTGVGCVHMTGNAGKDYKAKYRSLHYNLKDAANPELRARVLTGELVPGALVRLSNQDLASRVRLMRC